MEVEKIAKFLAGYKGDDLDYDYLARSDTKNRRYVNGVKIRISLPIAYRGGFEYIIANRIAQKYGITFEEYDFNRGTDDPPFRRPVFSTTCHNEDEVKTRMKTMIKAKQKLISGFEKLTELAVEPK